MRTRRLRKHPEALEVSAFINLIVVLVPFLLSTAVFSRMAVVDLTLPAKSSGIEQVKEGNLLLEVSARGADIGPLDVMDGEDPEPAEDPSMAQMRRDYPVVASLRPLLQQDHSGEEFDIALEELLERIAAIKDGTGE